MVRPVMVQGPGGLAPEQEGIQTGIDKCCPEAPFEGRADVAHGIQLVPDPTFLQRLFIGGNFARRFAVDFAEFGYDIDDCYGTRG